MSKEDKYADEIMSDDELDNVAGGSGGGTKADSRFLRAVGLMTETVSIGFFGEGWTDGSRAVDDGWSKGGIGCCTKNLARISTLTN